MKCGKVRYRDRIAAQLALGNTGRKRASRREECRAYRCWQCRGWHLTSQARRPASRS